MLQCLSVLVENRAGVLTRVTSLFARRGFNIESLAVGTTQNPAVSRITITLPGDSELVRQLKAAVVQHPGVADLIKLRDDLEREYLTLAIRR